MLDRWEINKLGIVKETISIILYFLIPHHYYIVYMQMQHLI
jgi:hypothetical protein